MKTEIAKVLRILSVEDSPDDTEIAMLALRESGYEPIYEIVDTADALRAALSDERWDLILADYSIPGFNGIEALRIVRETNTDIPFILVSGTIGDERAVMAMKAGANDYVLKSNLTRLGPAVTRELRDMANRRERVRAQQAIKFLLESSTSLAESLDLRATLANVARLSLPFLADWCMVDLIEEGGRIHRAAVAHFEPAKEKILRVLQERYPPDWNSRQPAVASLRTAKPVILAEITEQVLRETCQNEEHANLIRSAGAVSVIALPLLARGKTIGALTFGTSHPDRRYSPTALALAEEVARRDALAIDNARLYLEAIDAVKIRDEFLSVASHELKTPLTPLQLQIEVLLLQVREYRGNIAMGNLEEGLAVAHRQVERLTGLINRLLDISRITSGKLQIEPETIELTSLVRDVIARFQGAITEAQCRLTVDAERDVTGVWDRMRIEQVVTNLVSNAVKYGAGKPIEIKVSSLDGLARFMIRDQGSGIAPENQKRIFERFERAVSSHHYGGMGLGLWIARQIVDTHGGSILVTSEPGVGSTFVVELPRALLKPER